MCSNLDPPEANECFALIRKAEIDMNCCDALGVHRPKYSMFGWQNLALDRDQLLESIKVYRPKL